MPLSFLPLNHPVAELRQGIMTNLWQRWVRSVHEIVGKLDIVGNTLVNQPTGLTLRDVGRLFMVTDYGHLVRWTGAVWQFAPGDGGNKFFRDFISAPQETGWQLCDGTAGVTYLVVGGIALTTASLTVPNFTATPAYRRSAAAYSGPGITAAVAPGLTGGGTIAVTGASAVDATGQPARLEVLTYFRR